MRAVEREHHAQILPEQFTRGFAKAVERSGIKIEAGRTRPTFHEIRSLGITLYKAMGWPDDRVQALTGHANVEMTRHCMEGHEAHASPLDRA